MDKVKVMTVSLVKKTMYVSKFPEEKWDIQALITTGFARVPSNEHNPGT